jgi:arginine-tRNA-protein transferase
MFTEKYFLPSISGNELDAYLEKAWYRMGQAIFTCHFLFFDNNLFSPVWTRLPLEGYQFRKNLRKLIRKNQQRFRTVVRRAEIDEEKEQLFQQYRIRFNGQMSPTLRHNLLDDKDFNIYNTYEVAVYDETRLVAFSFFDAGNKSLASIKGVYDPEYAAWSLGFYSMLLEIQFGLEQGYAYYYPGYIVPGNPRFDYKLRMGQAHETEFYDLKHRRWRPFTLFQEELLPVRVLSQKLSEAAYALQQMGVHNQMYYYPAYEANIFGFENERFLESPLFLAVFNNVFPRPRFIIYYDLWQEKFFFTHCMPLEDMGFYFEYSMQFDTGKACHFLDFILKKTQIAETADVWMIARIAAHLSSLLKPPGFQRLLK